MILLPACADPKPPTFSVVEAAITDRTADAVVVTFTLEGTNNSNEPLPLDDVTYALNLNGRQVFAGTRDSEAALPPGHTQRIRLPVPVPTQGGTPTTGAVPYRFSGTMLYRLPGAIAEVFFDSGFRTPSVGFSESGNLDFSQSTP
ncbi:MAG: LEA type 2 family protein [Phycisphaerales bacterium]